MNKINSIHYYEKRGPIERFVNWIFFPIRVFFLFGGQYKWGLTPVRDDRFFICGKLSRGFVLDIGCGEDSIFVRHFIKDRGIGLDFYNWKGIDIQSCGSELPFKSGVFDTVTIIGSLNHIPKSKRIHLFADVHRVLKSKGILLVTDGSWLPKFILHKWGPFYDWLFNSEFDKDHVRGMDEEESYNVGSKSVLQLMQLNGISFEEKVYFNWRMNIVYCGRKLK